MTHVITNCNLIKIPEIPDYHCYFYIKPNNWGLVLFAVHQDNYRGSPTIGNNFDLYATMVFNMELRLRGILPENIRFLRMMPAYGVRDKYCVDELATMWNPNQSTFVSDSCGEGYMRRIRDAINWNDPWLQTLIA